MTNMSDPLTPTLLQERSEFYLTLAQAFLTPQTEAHYRAMVDYLADDLADLGRSLTYRLETQVDALRAALSKLASPEELLVVYSRMFLQPPCEAALNVCYPLDGAMMGGTVAEIENYYRWYGVERGEHFKDLADHVSVQLEFVSWLYAQAAQGMPDGTPDAEAAARHFLHQFVLRWAPHLEQGIEEAGRKLDVKTNPYLPLARILSIAAHCDAAANPDWVKPRRRAAVAIEKARRNSADRGITPDAMAEMERILSSKGLSTDHLHLALHARREAPGHSTATAERELNAQTGQS